MLSRPARISLLGLVLLACLYYSWFTPSQRTPEQNHSPSESPKLAADQVENIIAEPGSLLVEAEAEPQTPGNSSSTIAQLKIFGRVVDENNDPIENVLVSEEVSFISTRTDANGQYHIAVDTPRIKYPFLNFLHTGYEGKRTGVTEQSFDHDVAIKLDVTLKSSDQTTTVDGWIGDDNGQGLAGQLISIVAKGEMSLGFISYVVSSDENGNFSFEGIRSGIDYKLEVLQAPNYLSYVVDKLKVTKSTPRLNIVLSPIIFTDVEGMIINTKGEPVANFEILVKNLSTGSNIRQVSSDSSGFFKLENFPIGEVLITTRLPGYFKIEGVKLAEYDYRPLSIVVDTGDYYLSGWISDENGNAVAEARITLDTEIDNGEIKTYSYRSQVTDNAGNFYFADIGSPSQVISVYAKGFDKKIIGHQFESLTSEVHIQLSRISK